MELVVLLALNVALADTDVDGALETVEELQLLGVKAVSYEVDVANYDEIVAINNAGIFPKVSLLQGNPEDILRIMKVNLLPHFWTLRVFLPNMIANGRGHIVALGSVMGYEATGRAICYSTTKFGIRGLMDGLYDLIRIDNMPFNVTTVVPSFVNTRKELIENFIRNGGLNPACEMNFYTPQAVAESTVDGILKNKKYVILPPFFTKALNLIGVLPEEFQDLIRKNFKPNIQPEVNGLE